MSLFSAQGKESGFTFANFINRDNLFISWNVLKSPREQEFDKERFCSLSFSNKNWTKQQNLNIPSL